ncbi:hypothetical protein [Agromyces sp. NPDC055658]
MQALRAKVAEVDARQRDLPRAVCRVCGVTVPAGHGSRLPEAVWLDGPSIAYERQVDEARALAGRPVIDMWRRACDRHGDPTAEAVIEELLGLDVTANEARVAVVRFGRPLIAAQRWPVGDAPENIAKRDIGEPWGWIDREALREAVNGALGAMRPSRCGDGACGMCGRRSSIGWVRSSLQWADGSPAPVCRECDRALTKASSPTDIERIREVAAYELLGRWELAVDVAGLRLFVEVAGDEERTEGYGEPWSYRPEALAAVKRTNFLQHPRWAPSGERESIDAELAERRRELDEEAARKAEAEQPSWASVDWSS